MGNEQAGRAAPVRHGLARVLSKRGICSRSQAADWVAAGRVQVNGRVVRDPEHPTDRIADRIEIDGVPVAAATAVYIALNKPRGLVTTAADERGRETVYSCLADADLPWLAPVGRLDRASEGLLLLSNDPGWAAAITAAGQVDKRYHVQVSGTVAAQALDQLRAGLQEAGEWLHAQRVEPLRSGGRTTWLEFVLREGRNRQIRRMLGAVGLPVRRLVRVAVGPVQLGELAKGGWRHLADEEVRALAAPGR